MTEQDKILEEYWRIQPRGADGKRPRPCDVPPVVLTAADEEELARLNVHARRTRYAHLQALQQRSSP